MTTASPDTRFDRDRSNPWILGTFAASVALHAAVLLWLEARPRTPIVEHPPVEMTIVEIPPKPPEPKKEEPKPPEPPPKPKIKLKPPPIAVAKTEKPPPPPNEAAPPPPNEPPHAPTPPAPVVVGLTLSSTTSAGSFAANVGNTSYGKMGPKATDPNQAKAYSAPKYVPVYQVDREPETLTEVKGIYPEEARRAGIEGKVVMSITIDTEGKVINARVLKGLGYGLDQAAVEAMRKFKFRPAMKGGEPVSTEIQYSFSFLLD